MTTEDTEVDRRRYERRSTDRGGIDRRSFEDASPLGPGVYIGGIGAAARELNRGMRVGRQSWTAKWLTLAKDTPIGTHIVLHKDKRAIVGWSAGVEDLLANDWVVW